LLAVSTTDLQMAISARRFFNPASFCHNLLLKAPRSDSPHWKCESYCCVPLSDFQKLFLKLSGRLILATIKEMKESPSLV